MTEAPANPAPQGPDPAAALEALRQRGAAQADPIGFHYAEALARRSAPHQGAARCLLDGKLARALARCSEALDRAEAATGPAHAAPQDPARAGEAARPTALAELTRRLDRAACTPGLGPGSMDSVAEAATPAGTPTELRALQRHRGTWTRLSVDRQLTQSLAQVPENPGPLNSQLLVLRALRSMQETSPAYLQHFMAHADTLLWLAQAQGSAAPAPAKATRREADRPRKPAKAAKPPKIERGAAGT